MNSLEFRFVVLGLVIGCIVAFCLYFFSQGSASDRGDSAATFGGGVVYGGGANYAGNGGGSGGVVGKYGFERVYNPSPVAFVAQYWLFALEQPGEAFVALNSIKDPVDRASAIRWLLDAPSRLSGYQATPEQIAAVEGVLKPHLQAMTELVVNTTDEVVDASDNDSWKGLSVSLASAIRISEIYKNNGEQEKAIFVANIANDKAKLFRRLTKPIASNRANRFAETTEEAEEGEAEDGRASSAVANFLWVCPLLFGAFGFSLAGATRPVLEAFGKGVVGKAIADYLQSDEMASALGISRNRKS